MKCPKTDSISPLDRPLNVIIYIYITYNVIIICYYKVMTIPSVLKLNDFSKSGINQFVHRMIHVQGVPKRLKCALIL